MRRIGLILVLGFIVVLVSGCGGSKVVTVEVPKIEKEYITSTDTVHQFDSVYISNDRYIIGDTVVVSKYVDRYKYLYKTRVDTLLKTDTITIVNKEQIKALAKENDALKATMNFYRRLGLCLIGIIAVMGLYLIFKK